MKMQYDVILKHMGEFGHYQKTRCFLLWLTVIFVALHSLAWVFVGALPSHRCMLPGENSTYCLSDERLNQTIPWNDNEWNKCEMYDLNITENHWDIQNENSSTQLENIGPLMTNRTVRCKKWFFDRSEYKSSVVMEWNLVCEKGWIRAWAQTSYMLGVLCGSLILGSMSDKFGRKKVFCFCSSLMMTFGVLTSFLPNFISFCVFRFFTGAFGAGVYASAFILTVELVGTSQRPIIGTTTHFFFCFGNLLEALLAYFIRQWRYFQLAISVPMVFFLSYWWLIPESPRWLITNNRFEEAAEIIRKAARVNKKEVPEKLLTGFKADENYALKDPDVIQVPNTSVKNGASLLDIFKNSSLRKIAIITMAVWFIGDLSYYNLSLNTSSLDGNNYINFAISGAMEFPGYILCMLLLKCLGRKSSQCGTLVLSGVLLLFTLPVPHDYPEIITALTMAGKLFISTSLAITYMYCAELYPTEVRHVGISLAALAGKVGAAMTPFIKTMSDYKPLPNIITGSLSIIVGITVLLLPETSHKELTNKIDDKEETFV